MTPHLSGNIRPATVLTRSFDSGVVIDGSDGRGADYKVICHYHCHLTKEGLRLIAIKSVDRSEYSESSSQVPFAPQAMLHPQTISSTQGKDSRLPANKSDCEAVSALNTLSSGEIEPMIPELLTWLQDANWPIFGPVLELLKKHSQLLTEPVRGILQGDDSPWIAHCLEYLVAGIFSREQRLELRLEVERIARNPTKEECEWDAHETAQEIFDELELHSRPVA